MKKITLWSLTILFIILTGLSLAVPYYLISGGMLLARQYLPNLFYAKFYLIVLPFFIFWLGILLSKGNWREIQNHARALVVFVAIFLVVSFSLFKWTVTVNMYGTYGRYVKNADQVKLEEFYLQYIDKNSTSFEKETIYQETINSQYNLEFKKIWTFDAFVFLSAFLLLSVLPKTKN